MHWLLGLLFSHLVVSAHAIHMFSMHRIPFIENLENVLPHHEIPPQREKRLSPIILIPGDGGSRMDAMLDKPERVHFICSLQTDMFFDIWLNKELLLWRVIDCLVDNLRLVYNNDTRRTENAPGVTIRIPGWGYSETVEWIDTSHASVSAYYVNLANALVMNGYHVDFPFVVHHTISGKRLGNEHFIFTIKLKMLIEETYQLNENTPVTLIAHSMGGPMVLHFLHRQTQEWKDKYIRRLISLAGAWGGSIKSMKVYAMGDNLNSNFVSNEAIRALEITTPSLAWLMPSPLFFKPQTVLAKTNNRNYTMEDLQDFFHDIDCPLCWEMHKDVLPYMLNFTPPGVEVHCFYGSQQDTVEMLDYDVKHDLSGIPTLIYGDGDGTVNRISLEACQHWVGQQKQPVYLREYPGNDHMGILANLTVLDDIAVLQLQDLH